MLVPVLVAVAVAVVAVVEVAVDEGLLVVFVEELLMGLANPPTSPRPRVSSCTWDCEVIQLLTRVWF